MSRDHSSAPLKSNALKMPVPVITNTRLPSVTGDGDDMFCLRITVLPPPSAFFQSTVALGAIDGPQRQRILVGLGDVQEDDVAPDDRRGAAAVGHRQLPGDVFCLGPGGRQAFFGAQAVGGRSAPRRPVLRRDGRGSQRREEQSRHESARHGPSQKLTPCRPVAYYRPHLYPKTPTRSSPVDAYNVAA